MSETKKLSISQAYNETLHRILEADKSVFVLGEDITDPMGGAFKVTAGLSTKFGEERVREAPISELAIIGAATGAAMLGSRPVAEIQVADFYAVGLDQLANHAAKLRYMSGGRTTVPIVVRGTFTGGLNFAAQHSQAVEAWLVHTPGLKVAVPSTPADAAGILATAIYDPDPVVILEAAVLYGVTGQVPVGDHRVPLGKSRIVQEGTDVTIVTYGPQINVAQAAAKQLADEGTSVEIIDLRWLQPWDEEAVLASVGKTRRAVVLHQAVKRAGFGAEIASVVQENLWGTLTAPVLRVAGKNTPVPFASELEQAWLPQAHDVVEAVRAVTK
jgi:pyruvate dehydrogenase E1 component beta subunit